MKISFLFPLTGLSRTGLAAFAVVMGIPLALIVSRSMADILTVLLGVLFLWHSAGTRDWRWLNDPVVRIGLLAWGWMVLVVTPFSAFFMASLGASLVWIRFLLLYAALRHWVLKSPGALNIFSTLLGALLLFVACDTLWQYVSGTSLSGHTIDGSGRLTGPMDNVKVGLYLVKLLLPVAALNLHFSLCGGHVRRVVAALALLMLGMAAVMLSGERTPFLMGMVGISVGAIFLMVAEPRMRRTCITLLLTLLLVTTILLTTQPWLQKRSHDLYNNLSGFSDSSYGELFRVGYELGKEYWPTGTGLKGFRELCPDFIKAGMVTHCNLHPHNPYIEWFAETGLVGLLLFCGVALCLLHAALRSFFRAGGIERLLPATAIAVWCIHFFPLMPTQSYYSNWPGILLWYSLGMAFAALNLVTAPASAVPGRPGPAPL